MRSDSTTDEMDALSTVRWKTSELDRRSPVAERNHAVDPERYWRSDALSRR